MIRLSTLKCVTFIFFMPFFYLAILLSLFTLYDIRLGIAREKFFREIELEGKNNFTVFRS